MGESTIPTRVIDAVRERVDLVALVARTVNLAKSGANWKGLCPFHEEKTPSFTVSPARRTWKCFGCDTRGDAFAWVQRIAGLSFPDAVRELAAEVGVEVDADEAGAGAAKKGGKKGKRRAPTVIVEFPDADDDRFADADDGRFAEADDHVDELEAPAPAGKDDDLPAEPLLDVEQLGDLWDALGAEAGRWRRLVVQWGLERGFGEAIAAALPELGEVAAWPGELRGFDLAELKLRWAPLDLWIAVRSREGRIVDIERRFARGTGKPPGKCPKTMRLRARFHIPPAPIGVMFGRVADAVAAAARGEPVIFVEGSADYLLAAACCRLAGRGAVLGGVSKSGKHAAAAFIQGVRRHQPLIRVGTFTAYVVPHVGDKDGGGERAAWSVGVALLDVAPVVWSPPARLVEARTTNGRTEMRVERLRKGDLCDALTGLPDVAGAFTDMLESGKRMFETVDVFERDAAKRSAALRRWREMPDEEFPRHFYRMPVDELIEYLHWVQKRAEGEVTTVERLPYIMHRGAQSGLTRATRLLLRWLDEHRITFVANRGGGPRGRWVWDPWDRASVTHRDRTMPRLIGVGGDLWGGWVQHLGMINPAETLGKRLDQALKQASQQAPGVELRTWMTSDGALAQPTIRVHLHSVQERVLRVDGEGIEVVSNNAAGDILVPSALVSPLEWKAGVPPVDAARALWQLIGQYISLSPVERLIAMAWALMAPLRERLSARPILWGVGDQGDGKSMLGKMLMSLFYGRRNGKPAVFTAAGRWEAARTWPFISNDNGERRFVGPEDEQLILTVSTSAGRHRRSSEGDWDTVMQDGAPLLHWTAKGRPWNPEIQRRCLLFIHERRWHVDGMRESAVLDAIVAARADIWSGVMRMYSELVMPALRGLQHERYADFWGTQHALSGMREALGVMAVISDTLTLCAPEWGHGGPSMVNRWVELLGARAAEAQQNNDPLGIALDELLFDWNRCVVTPTAGYRRPSVEDALYQCRPVYKSCPALRDATKDQPGGPVLVTPNENQAELAPNTRMPVIAGFVGTYPQLHRDLLRVAQESRALKELFPTPDEIRFNIGNTLGWTSTVARRHGARGLREYQWARVDQSTEEGDQS